MTEPAITTEDRYPDYISNHLEDDFYTIEQTAEILAYADRLNSFLKHFLNGIPNIRDEHGRLRAFMTLCTPDYFFGIIGLSRSLQNNSSIPLICLTDSEFELANAVDLPNVHFVRIPRLINRSYAPSRKEFSNVLSKLWVFGLHAFDRLVYLDSDLCILSSIRAFRPSRPGFCGGLCRQHDHAAFQQWRMRHRACPGDISAAHAVCARWLFL